MTLEDSVRDDIAFIRRAVEQGRGFATRRSLDMLVWGVAVALGYLGTYATVVRWWHVNPNWIWAACIGLPWLYSLRRLFAPLLLPSESRADPPPMVQALRMLWFGCGIFLSTLAVAVIIGGDMRQGWFNAVSAGVLGIGFFASSFLCSLTWMRWIGVGWWAAALLLYALRNRVEVLPLSAALMLLLLALPGLLLWRGRPTSAAK
jgi:hypothetical protein